MIRFDKMAPNARVYWSHYGGLMRYFNLPPPLARLAAATFAPQCVNEKDKLVANFRRER